MTKNEQGNAMSKDSGLSRRDLMGAMALSIAVGRLVPSPAAADMTDQKPIGGRTMTLDEYSRYDAVGLAELVRRQEISPTELAHTALAAVAAVNPRINAVVETFPERVASATASGPLGGVPFLRKDILIQEAGGLTEFGSRFAAGLRMPDASELALRFQRAGLVTLGRTTTPELAFNATTENVKDGPTRNPWNRDRSAGGSSGGSAAIVAAGAVPAAHGNDGGGSIRIPAGCCGIVGLKPTRGRVSLGPGHGTVLLGLVAEHALTRTVRDSAAILDATQGASFGDPYVIAPPARPFLEEIGVPVGRLRIAYTKKTWTGVDVHPEIAMAVERTAKLCSDLGHDVVEATPAIDAEAFGIATRDIWCSFIALGIEGLAIATGRKPTAETLEASNLACMEYGKSLTAVDLYRADAVMNRVSRDVARFFTPYDVLLTPTIAQRTLPIGAPLLDGNASGLSAQKWVEQIFTYAPFTSLFNTTGQPAVSLPLEQDSDGLPVGMQFVAKYGEEGLLFRLAASLEEARPWNGRRPAIWAGNQPPGVDAE
jgi:amidase